MTVKSGQTWSGLVVCKDATGALATPSVGPAGALYVDGVVNAASVTVSGSNPYKWTVTLPTLTAGQCVSMYITATIATIATASVVVEDVADTVLLSDGVTVSTGGITSASFASGAITAAAIAADAIGSSELAATAAAEIAAAVIAGGAGTYSYSDTVDDGSGNLLDGVFIQLSTNSGFTNIVMTTYTNALGAFTVYSDTAGTHYLRLQLAGYIFADQTVTLA